MNTGLYLSPIKPVDIPLVWRNTQDAYEAEKLSGEILIES